MAQPKRLTHKQREVATELMASVSLMEMSANQLREEVEQLEADSKERALPEAVINGVLYAETYFRIRGVELKIKEPRRGPLKVFRRRLLVQLESI